MVIGLVAETLTGVGTIGVGAKDSHHQLTTTHHIHKYTTNMQGPFNRVPAAQFIQYMHLYKGVVK